MLQFLGQVQNPLTQLGSSYGDVQDGGLISFISNLLRLITVAAGLFAMFNFLIAGLDFITSKGDPKGVESARNKIIMSIIGLVVIVGSFAGAALAGQILFDDASAILEPVIYGPGA